MRVLHVLSSLEVGGAEVAALRLAAAQKVLGIDPMVVGVRGGPLVELANALGLHHAALDSRSGLATGAALARIGCRFRPQLVNTHNPGAHSAARALRWPGRRTVLTLHGLPSRNYGPLVTSRNTAAVISVSDRVRDRFLELHPRFPPGQAVTILNGVELPTLDHASRADASFTVVAAARFDPIKDLGTLVRAIAIAAQQVDLQLILAGDGHERPHLESLVSDLGIQSRVSLPGMLRDLGPVYQTGDVVALSSTSEGLPISLLEGMAWGLPVVATAVGGVPELVVNGHSGLLVTPGDPTAFAVALVRLAVDKSARAAMGSSARETVAAGFSLDRMARNYHQLYLAALGR